MSLSSFYIIVDIVFPQASLISAAFISSERFYAIYWPFEHRTLSMRALIPYYHSYFVDTDSTYRHLLRYIIFLVLIRTEMTYVLILTFIICGSVTNRKMMFALIKGNNSENNSDDRSCILRWSYIKVKFSRILVVVKGCV